MSRWALCLLAACGPPAAPATPTQPLERERPATIFTIADRGVGPIDKDTPANLTALRRLVGPQGYTVRPINDGGVELHVYDAKQHLFYVIPNDDGSLFNLHVVSGSVPITQHPEWVVGKPFSHSGLLTDCECWGTHPVCWKDGDHVALGFRRKDADQESDCDSLGTARERESLEGHPIQRAVWSPKPFGSDDNDARAEDLPTWIPRADP